MACNWPDRLGGWEEDYVRIAWAVGAANVPAILALPGTGREQRAALVAIPPHALSRLPIDLIRPSTSDLAPERDLLGLRIVVGYDWRIGLQPARQCSTPLPQVLPFRFVQFRRVSNAVSAPLVLAVDAVPFHTECLVADVAVSPHTHPNRLLDTQSISIRGMPLLFRYVQTKPLRQSLSALLVDLSLGDPLLLGDLLFALPCNCRRGRRWLIGPGRLRDGSAVILLVSRAA
jgi:hypothetical protein